MHQFKDFHSRKTFLRVDSLCALGKALIPAVAAHPNYAGSNVIFLTFQLAQAYGLSGNVPIKLPNPDRYPSNVPHNGGTHSSTTHTIFKRNRVLMGSLQKDMESDSINIITNRVYAAENQFFGT